MIQKVMYEGYLADEPVMRFLDNGRAVCNFRIGSSRQYKDSKGEVMRETTWLKVTAWGKLGEIVNQFCAKGSHVIVEGALRSNKSGNPDVYKKNDGEYGASYEITADAVRILKGRDDAQGSEDTPTEDLPF
jgi:single-strand DNA-binding protein